MACHVGARRADHASPDPRREPAALGPGPGHRRGGGSMRFYENGQVLSLEQVESEMLEDYRQGSAERVAKGLDPIPDKPGGFVHERWTQFRSLLQPGDELRWFFKSWGPRAARFGYVVMRPGPSLV